MFINRDIGMVAPVADRIAVMYRGHTVEAGSVHEILSTPYHPYTAALLCAVLVVGARGREAPRARLAGDPGAATIGPGCRFAARCPRKLGGIRETVPPTWQQQAPGHRIPCHIPLAYPAATKPLLAGANETIR